MLSAHFVSVPSPSRTALRPTSWKRNTHLDSVVRTTRETFIIAYSALYSTIQSHLRVRLDCTDWSERGNTKSWTICEPVVQRAVDIIGAGAYCEMT